MKRWECYATVELPLTHDPEAVSRGPWLGALKVRRVEHISWHLTRRGARQAALAHTIGLRHRDVFPLLITYDHRKVNR